ncbi:MAG TPA: Gfo/Idh/MocA family oxidoreductase [Firmicutes bacterium]|nr:Gfo/Idh/MocA family oxidoreductase [Bacillota bacterium]
MSKYRVGVVGLVHGHIWGLLKEWNADPRAELVAVAEADPQLLQQATAYGLTKHYTSWQEMLEKEELDILQLGNENNAATEVVEAAAARGIHCILEKPMAATYEQAQRMYDACKQASVQLMVNWWTNWVPAIHRAMEMAKAQKIGQVVQISFRVGHAGPKEIGCSPAFYNWLYDPEKNGAGAYMDFCGYGAAICAWVLGEAPECLAVAGRLAKDYIETDDNGILILKYPKAIGLCEGTWTQIGPVPKENPVFYGSEGTLKVVGDKIHWYKPGAKTPEIIDPEPLPPGRAKAVEYFLTCLDEGTPVDGMCSAEVGLMSQAMLQKGLDYLSK